MDLVRKNKNRKRDVGNRLPPSGGIGQLQFLGSKWCATVDLLGVWTLEASDLTGPIKAMAFPIRGYSAG